MITIKESGIGTSLYNISKSASVIEVKIESGSTVITEDITIAEAKEMRDQLDDAIRSITRYEEEKEE